MNFSTRPHRPTPRHSEVVLRLPEDLRPKHG